MASDKEQLAWAFGFPSIDGGTVDFAEFKGRVLLVANTASFAVIHINTKGLEALFSAKSSAGLTVIGVPSQDFNQESPDNARVKAFCEHSVRHRFPADRDQPGSWARRPPRSTRWVNLEKQWQPKWNFYKVLIGRDRTLIAGHLWIRTRSRTGLRCPKAPSRQNWRGRCRLRGSSKCLGPVRDIARPGVHGQKRDGLRSATARSEGDRRDLCEAGGKPSTAAVCCPRISPTPRSHCPPNPRRSSLGSTRKSGRPRLRLIATSQRLATLNTRILSSRSSRTRACKGNRGEDSAAHRSTWVSSSSLIPDRGRTAAQSLTSPWCRNLPVC